MGKDGLVARLIVNWRGYAAAGMERFGSGNERLLGKMERFAGGNERLLGLMERFAGGNERFPG